MLKVFLSLVLIWPTQGIVTSAFGPRFGKHHDGIDIEAPIGTPVLSSKDGLVVYSGYSPIGYGNTIKVDHQGGLESVYGHLDSLHVSVGDRVQKGQLIGTVGDTGNSTGPHLHFEVRLRGKPLDPRGFLKSKYPERLP